MIHKALVIFACPSLINKRPNMELKNVVSKLSVVLCCLFMSSCAPTSYYQLVNTKPVGEGLKKTEKAVVYEDDNCTISYNLWANGGSTQIVFVNKTDEDIYIDLASTAYFMNNQAFDLHKGQLKTKSVVPARMLKVIEETDITIMSQIYRDCNLFLMPRKSTINTTSFSQDNTPYSFGLRIVYYVGNSDTPHKVKNEFYVDRICNYPGQSFVEYYSDDKACPDERIRATRKAKYKFQDADAFYIEYNPKAVWANPEGPNVKH